MRRVRAVRAPGAVSVVSAPLRQHRPPTSMLKNRVRIKVMDI
jgi:hypothetical protein